MANNMQPPQSAQKCIQDKSAMYSGYNPSTPTHLPLLGSFFILLPTKVTQLSIEDLKQLQKDFFYKGQQVQEEHIYVNIKDGN